MYLYTARVIAEQFGILGPLSYVTLHCIRNSISVSFQFNYLLLCSRYALPSPVIPRDHYVILWCVFNVNSSRTYVWGGLFPIRVRFIPF